MNRTIQEKIKIMLSNAQLPNGFWPEAMSKTIHLINRFPSRVLDKSEVAKMLWTGNAPLYKHLKIFGCEAYSHIPKDLRNKLEPKSKKCIFLGYGELDKMGYRRWEPELRKGICSNDVHFNEAKSHAKPKKTNEIKEVVFKEDGPSATTSSQHDAQFSTHPLPHASLGAGTRSPQS
ncbi:hypothetical protein L7F22_006070 [Adiantum nelumboides]|nr:hypothetical protein [Adiantum nelumboides]